MPSQIDPTVFPDNRKVDKQDLRDQFTIAKNEITALQEEAIDPSDPRVVLLETYINESNPLQAALDYLGLEGGTIIGPNRAVVIPGPVISIDLLQNFRLIGEGPDFSLQWPNTGGGLWLRMGKPVGRTQNKYQVWIQNVSFLTTHFANPLPYAKNGSGIGLCITWSLQAYVDGVLTTFPNNLRTSIGGYINNVQIGPLDVNASDGSVGKPPINYRSWWDDGLVIFDGRQIILDAVNVYGSGGNQGDGITLSGETIVTTLTNVFLSDLDNALFQIGTSEGLYWDQGYIVGANKGVILDGFAEGKTMSLSFTTATITPSGGTFVFDVIDYIGPPNGLAWTRTPRSFFIFDKNNPKTNFMVGTLTAWSGHSITVEIPPNTKDRTSSFGSGTISEWIIGPDADRQLDNNVRSIHISTKKIGYFARGTALININDASFQRRESATGQYSDIYLHSRNAGWNIRDINFAASGLSGPANGIVGKGSADVSASAVFQITAGESGSTIDITVDSTPVLAAPIEWTTSNEYTAELLTTAINQYQDTSGYTARQAIDRVVITAIATGIGSNGLAVNYTLTGTFAVDPPSSLTLTGGRDTSNAWQFFTVTGGSSGDTIDMDIDGIGLLSAPVEWTTSNAHTAFLLATAITANGGLSGYNACVGAGGPAGFIEPDSGIVTIMAIDGGTAPNGLAINFTLTGGFAVDVPTGLKMNAGADYVDAENYNTTIKDVRFSSRDTGIIMESGLINWNVADVRSSGNVTTLIDNQTTSSNRRITIGRNVNNLWTTDTTSFIDGDTTPNVAISITNRFSTTNTAPTSITYFDGATLGDVWIVTITDVYTTFVNSTNLILNPKQNFTGTQGDILVFAQETPTIIRQIGQLKFNVTGGTGTFSNAVTVSSYVSADTIRLNSNSVNPQTDTSYTLQVSDNGKTITLLNALPITLTVPSGIGAGFVCRVVQLGAGAVTITPDSTVLRSRVGLVTAGQYARAVIEYISDQTYVVSGDLIP